MEVDMCPANRGFLVLAVLFSLTSAPFSRLAGAQNPPPGRCGSQPGDADQVASVRATAAEQCDCASATDHGRYENCVHRVANAAVRAGSLRHECRDSVVRCAERSTCGRKHAVTCCRTNP